MQELKNSRYLVSSGGGVNGLCELGSMRAIQRMLNVKHLNDHFKGYAGCSIGAFLSLGIVCGFSPEEIVEELSKYQFDLMHFSISLCSLKDNLSLRENFYPLDLIVEKFLQRVLEKNGDLMKRTGNSEKGSSIVTRYSSSSFPSKGEGINGAVMKVLGNLGRKYLGIDFRDLDFDRKRRREGDLERENEKNRNETLDSSHSVDGTNFRYLYEKTRKHLKIGTVNLNSSLFEFFDHEQTPFVPVKAAVLASMALPLVFPSVVIGNSLYCDGALMMNFPFHAFPPSESFGLWLQTKPQPAKIADLLQRTKTRFKQIFFSLLYTQDNLVNTIYGPTYKNRIVTIPSPYPFLFPHEAIDFDEIQRQGFLATIFHFHKFFNSTEDNPHCYRQIQEHGSDEVLARVVRSPLFSDRPCFSGMALILMAFEIGNQIRSAGTMISLQNTSIKNKGEQRKKKN